MGSILDDQPAATPLQAAMDGFGTALSHLIKVVEDGALRDLGAVGMVSFLQEFEAVRNTMPVVDRAVIEHGIEQGAAPALCQPNMARVLASGLRVSAAEAGRRVRAAEHLADRRSMVGEPLAPVRPHLARAQRDGLITPEQVAVIDDALRKVDRPCFDPAQVEGGEQILAEAAQALGPADLRELAQRVVDGIDPDGVLPDEETQRRRRYLHFRRQRDGSVRGEFRLTPQAGAKFEAMLGPLAPPKTTRCVAGEGDPEGAPASRIVEPDDRTRGQRLHDALEDVCDRMLRSDQLPESGGTPATVFVHIDIDRLLDRTGVGHYADGTPVRARTVAEMADGAEIAWCLKDAKGAVLDLGRTRRIATHALTLALIARDGGCSFPGCDTAPEWSERHHIVPWLAGGPTSLDNLTLLCAYHHHNFLQRGWDCRLNEERLPVWIPPKWIDRLRRPILNARIRVRRWRPQDPLPV
jgi:hypothetical protein